MKVVNWDEELQYFAENNIRHLNLGDRNFCGATFRHKHVSIITQYWQSNGELWAEGILETTFNIMRSNITLNLQMPRIKRLSAIIDAKTDAVGCSYGRYRLPERISSIFNLEFTMVVVCLFNQNGNKNFTDLYVTGEPCTKCECIERCNGKSLCEYKHLVGVTVDCEISRNILERRSRNYPLQEFCERDESVEMLYLHFHIIYTFIFICLIMHFVVFMYYKRME